MKILIVINSLRYGGAEKQVVFDANNLQKRGHKVAIAFYYEGELSKILNANVNCYKINSKSSILSCFQMTSHFLFHKYDIIHCHMFWGAKVAAISGKLTGHKVVLNEHGLGLWRKWYHILMLKFLSLFIDKIVNSCETSKRIRLERENLKKEKLVTIYNSVELYSDNHKANLPTGTSIKRVFTVGFIGRFNEVKRLNLFLNVAERLKGKLPDFKIVLVGDGEEREKIEEEIKRRNLTEYFNLPGYVLDAGECYRNFDVFVLLSRIEGFSVALLEAEASGIPAIAFDVGGNSEIIKNNITGFLLPDLDIDILVEKIIYLYENPQKRKEMGNEARNYIESNFSNDLRIKKLEKLYQDIIKKNSGKN